MKALELRQKYLDFFTSKNHVEISGKSLIPEHDPTVLFTTAGMHPLVPYILGEPHPAGKRLVNFQKCIRTVDIENVGDASHITYIEMLGNWSIGDYFKDDAIRFSYEFLTSPEWLNIPQEQLHISVFEGDDDVPRDKESAVVWKAVGIPEDRIYYLPREDNWWGPAGKTGPCGPDTEMFVDTGKEACSTSCRPGCSCGKYFEIWNDVFMQYDKKEDGTYGKLEMKTVDTGMGVERTAAMLQGKGTVYDTELFVPILDYLSRQTGKAYGRDGKTDESFRIVADHVRAACFILADESGVKPSNLAQGYILRRLIRRAIRHGRKLLLENSFIKPLAEKIIDTNAPGYPELVESSDSIMNELVMEEERFSDTLKKGEREFEKLIPNLLKNPKKQIPGRIAFRLYDTYGFPLELTEELAEEHEFTVDREEFDAAFAKHQALSKAGSEKIFKGGLADHQEKTKMLHTATHLLHQALRIVLGDHVAQKGSNITEERLRFDFSHPQKMTPEEIEKAEAIVNEQIDNSLAVHFDVMTIDEARDRGAVAFFGERYGEKVKVYSIGSFSKEVCGGPHVENTRSLGRFRILKEQSSSAGIRRIRAVLKD